MFFALRVYKINYASNLLLGGLVKPLAVDDACRLDVFHAKGL
jgi:hypothetical protein